MSFLATSRRICACRSRIALVRNQYFRKTNGRVPRHVSAANVADWNSVKPGAAFKAGQQVVLYLPVQMKTAGAKPGRGGQNANDRQQEISAINRGVHRALAAGLGGAAFCARLPGLAPRFVARPWGCAETDPAVPVVHVWRR